MTISILLTYHTAEGQTEKIALRIAEALRAHGAVVDMAHAEHDPTPARHDGVVVGDSIHAGRHSRELRKWLSRHAEQLDGMPVALFQVSLTSANDDEAHVHQAHGMVAELLDDTGLDPDLVGLFAGALAYTRYGWFKRHLMRRVAASEGGDTDTTRDYEYTDWDAVDHFADDAYSLISGAGVAAA